MEASLDVQSNSPGRAKFLAGGLLIIAAIGYLIASATRSTAQFFLTVDELLARGDSVVGRDLRLSGAVIGETIEYDPETLTLTFSVAHMPGDIKEVDDQGGLAAALHAAINDPTRSRLEVVYIGPKPDLLRHEAQAIVTGKVGENGVFYADELLLKCPTRYEEYSPDQVQE